MLNNGKPAHPSLYSLPYPPAGSLAESRRKGIYQCCGEKWRPGHLSEPGTIWGYELDRFKNGDAAVHIFPDLDPGIKGELERHTASFDGDGEVHRPESSLHFSGTEHDLPIFDGLLDT